MMKRARRNRKSEAMQEMPKNKSILGGMMDVPLSAVPKVTQMEISDNREAIVDGCKGILEYDEHVIRLMTEKMTVNFFGRSLQIKVLTKDSAVVTGFITSIEFKD